ncbi:uncharacterized protein LOC111020533 isoform X3 [Momordica charantia]|uniref:Uncharacterized protein LOC111020533 isoform X3 n=1 Tax=Momordica charantia TaxID=3673 RepID=A0A6J1DG63_MOMCH|nr:uncharacterized protein LOC111020533 isoform X3 [Momordica charantia]
MVKDTRSSVRAKNEENNNPKGKQNGDKATTRAGSSTPDTSALRRSARETSWKKKIVSTPSSSRKSERLEKQPPSTPCDKKKRGTIEDQDRLNLLRRSQRGKNQSSSTSSGSGSKKSDKSSGSPNIKRKKEKKEKSIKQLTLGTGEVGNSGKQDEVSEHAKSKRMDARAYRALYREKLKKANSSGCQERRKMPKSDTHGDSNGCKENLNGSNKFSDKSKELSVKCLEESSTRALEDFDETRTKIAKEVVENDVGLDFFPASQKSSKEEELTRLSNGDGGSVDAVIYSSGKLKTSERTNPNSILGAMPADDHIDSDGDCKLISLKRKRSVDLDSNGSARNESENSCPSPAGAIESSSSPCRQSDKVETCDKCLERQRVDNNSKDFCSCVEIDKQNGETSIDMDRGKHIGNVISDSAGNCVWCKLEKASSDIDPNACLICKVGGKLLCCEGKECRRSFHLSCLDPPLENVPLGVWHCPMCIGRKIKFGVHAVSKGFESIWDTREVEISDADGLQRRKQYFVKYKDLGHAHNRWILESELLLEASSLVSRFNRRNQYSRWKQAWAVPQRLLQKRLLFSTKLCEEHDREVSGVELNCQYEWLVKWRGLDYKCATWELESSAFLRSHDGQGLMVDYESRCEKAKLASHVSKIDKILERKATAVVNQSQFSDRDTNGFNDNYMNNVNKLRKFWHEGKNAIVIDNQDRVGKVIAFILSLQPDVLRPFLIISTSTALGFWDDELLRFAPSFSAVVYKGNKNIRKNIRDLEFYQGNFPTFQALICSPEVMMEDLDVLKCINWEVIIIDECQRPTVSSHFEKMKMLHADMWLLVLAGQLKDTKDDYHNLLSLLESNDQIQSEDTLKTSDCDNISKLKERLSYYTAYTCTSKFVEYWVPAQISNVQLELYCATLLSNTALLCSSFKNDLLDSIHDMLISTRKCCNHPYIADPSMAHIITKGHPEVEYLNIGIKASGKLQLLDAMLMEMKKKGLRVLILFQSISGSGRDSIGDILDDFLRQRFGPDSYERIDGGLIYSKKQAALNKFNNLESGRFLFLLEVRACLPSIKLSSVDSIVIYDSDWTPMNDLRALQRITLDSQLEQIKIFRLYSSCTVDEKVLMLSLQNRNLDGNLQNVSWSHANMLLMWGASDLFANLEKFHDKEKTADSLTDTTLLKEVVHDLILLMSQNAGSTNKYDSRVILKVQQVEGVYSAHSPLLGQLKMPSTEEMHPLIFWTKLLDGKCPKWKYTSDRSLRNRKRVQHSDDSSQKPELELVESARKRKKMSNSNVKVAQDGNFINTEKEGPSGAPKHTCQTSNSSAACEDDPYIENQLSSTSLMANDSLKILEYKSVGSDGITKLIDLRKSLHRILKPEVSQLCQILKLPENVEKQVEKFFEYIMDNHHVIMEPATTTLLQAFQLSLCWTAASMLKYKIDHKESLALAKKHLNFDCNRQEVYLLYSILRCLKKIFSNHLECYKVPESSFASEPLYNVLSDNEFEKAVVKCINRIQKNCCKKFENLKQKQQEEKDDFDRTCDEEKSLMEKQFRMESAVIRSCLHNSVLMRKNKLQVLENKYSKKLEEHQCQIEIRRKKLEEEHVDERDKMLATEAHWVETLTSWLQVELLNKQILNETRHGRYSFLITEQFHGLGTDTTVCDRRPVDSRSKFLHNVSGTGVGVSEIPGSVSCEAIICSNAVDKCSLQTRHNGETTALDTIDSQGPSATEFDDHNRINDSNGIRSNTVKKCSLQTRPNGQTTTSDTVVSPGLSATEFEDHNSINGSNSIGGNAVERVSLQTRQNGETTALDTVDSQQPSATEFADHNRINNSNGIQGSLTSLESFAVGKEPDGVILSNLDKEVSTEGLNNGCSVNGVDVVSVHLPTSGEQISHSEDVGLVEGSQRFLTVPLLPSTEGGENFGARHPGSEVPSGTCSIVNPDLVVDADTNPEASPCGLSFPIDEVERLPETVNLLDVRENLSAGQSECQELIPNQSILSPSDIEISSRMHTTAFCEVGDSRNSSNDGKDLCETFNPCVVEDTIGITNLDVYSHELSVTLSPVELAVSPTTQGNGTLLFNQAAHNEMNQESSSTGSMDDIMHATEMAITNGDTEAPISFVANQSNQEAHDEMNQQPPSTEPTDDIMQGTEMANTNGGTKATISNVVDQYNQEAQMMEPQTPMVSLATNSSAGCFQINLSSAGGMEDHMGREDHSSARLPQTVSQPVENPIEPIEEVLLQSMACTAPHSTPNVAFSDTRTSFLDSRTISANFDISNGLVQPMQPSVLQMPTLLYIDPFQKELERLRKEMEQYIDLHEKRKLQLKSEREKEIEEFTAQVHKKYDAKLQESETELDLRKKDFDVNYHKVMMGQSLGHAFRWKSNDTRACG